MQLYFKKSPTHVLSCEYCKMFKNSFFWTPQVTASVLWTIIILNYNHALENLRTMNDFNFTNFFSDRVMGCSTEGASYYCFRRAILKNFFQKVLLINFTSLAFQFCSLSADRRLWKLYSEKGSDHCRFRRAI